MIFPKLEQGFLVIFDNPENVKIMEIWKVVRTTGMAFTGKSLRQNSVGMNLSRKLPCPMLKTADWTKVLL